MALLITFTAGQALAQTAPSAGSWNHSQTWENHQAYQGSDYKGHNISYDNYTPQSERNAAMGGGGYHNASYDSKHNYKGDRGSWHKGYRGHR